MDYEFGDILDARNVPSIKHFILTVGEVSKKGEADTVMYYIITSRVYTVFSGILEYYNDCLRRKDGNFFKFYGKEKNKPKITPHGLLTQAVFLDKHTHYDACLDVESMIVLNSDPLLIDKTVLETFRADGKLVVKSRLAKIDAINIAHNVKYSNEVSPDRKVRIATP